MYGIDFDKYTPEELDTADMAFRVLVSYLIGECSDNGDTCKDCRYRRLCDDCRAAHNSIKATKARKTRD